MECGGEASGVGWRKVCLHAGVISNLFARSKSEAILLSAAATVGMQMRITLYKV